MDQLHCNCTQLHLSIIAIVTLYCRFVNKSSVHTQLSSCHLTARHIGDPELRTQPFYYLNMTAKINLAKLSLQSFSSKTHRRAEASFKNAGTTSERPDPAVC